MYLEDFRIFFSMPRYYTWKIVDGQIKKDLRES